MTQRHIPAKAKLEEMDLYYAAWVHLHIWFRRPGGNTYTSYCTWTDEIPGHVIKGGITNG